MGCCTFWPLSLFISVLNGDCLMSAGMKLDGWRLAARQRPTVRELRKAEPRVWMMVGLFAGKAAPDR